VRDSDGRYWDPELIPSRVNVGGDPPYVEDDRAFVFVIGLGE
jgi:hypothetical protein